MTLKFFTTNNVRWFAVTPVKGKPGSERMTLYAMIERKPGISSDELQEHWDFPSSMRSRLKELLDAKNIRAEHRDDLFA